MYNMGTWSLRVVRDLLSRALYKGPLFSSLASERM